MRTAARGLQITCRRRRLRSCLAGACMADCLVSRMTSVEPCPSISRTAALTRTFNPCADHGETVRFVVRNRTARAHDFAIGTPYRQKQRRRLLQSLDDAGMSGPEYYDLPDYRAFNAVFVPPGATRELVWWFNSSERLEYASNVPGHYERGTWGVFDFSGRARSGCGREASSGAVGECASGRQAETAAPQGDAGAGGPRSAERYGAGQEAWTVSRPSRRHQCSPR